MQVANKFARIFVIVVLVLHLPITTLASPKTPTPKLIPISKPFVSVSGSKLNLINTAPTEFDARYSVSLNGLPTGLSAHSRLRKHNEHFLFSLESDSWVMKYYEKSAFTWPDNNICSNRPEHYRFSFKGFNIEEYFEVDFNYHTFLASMVSNDKTKQYEILPGVSDAISYLLVLQCDLKTKETEPSYKIGYKYGIDNYRFKYLGEEKMRTPFGKLNTMKLERIYVNNNNKTTYWVAPELNYFLVKMKHKEGKIVSAKLSLRELKRENLENLYTEEDFEQRELEESMPVDNLEDDFPTKEIGDSKIRD